MSTPNTLKDEEIVERVLRGEAALYEVLFRRHDQRLYRIARAILRNNSEARDVVQHTYVQAYEHLRQFSGRAKFSTWLSAIAVHEASLRRRRYRRLGQLDEVESPKIRATLLRPLPQTPEENASATELRHALEAAIDALPEKYRVVLVMRDVEGMSTAEAAACLGITEQNVKVRLHRAHGLLRKGLYELFGSEASEIFRFGLSRCDHIVEGVLRRVVEGPPPKQQPFRPVQLLGSGAILQIWSGSESFWAVVKLVFKPATMPNVAG